ncbi:MAG: hypothetical protein K0R16_493 [Nitrososphaeraceae archaeon]|jgi:hypothetical protein|nr:hypothetical protein [Nitrososphaeraceae archaeon]
MVDWLIDLLFKRDVTRLKTFAREKEFLNNGDINEVQNERL